MVAPNSEQPFPWRLALVAMPWSLFNRPSIQVGTLKGFLQQQAGDWLAVDTLHPYLEVAYRLGADLYQRVSRNLWISEALYAPLLYPDRQDEAWRLAASQWRRQQGGQPFDPGALTGQLANHLDSWLENQDWQHCNLVGFSVCFHQLFASLAAAGRLKERFPELPVVFGGSFCAPEAGPSLLARFPQIDYVISGEGELPLLDLCRFLAGRQEHLTTPVHARPLPARSAQAPGTPCQMASLAELPPPDYSDYLAKMEHLFGKEPFVPVLPVEFSRGCWWAKCTFCNLNLQWRGYRMKEPERLVEEVLALTEKSGSLDLAFTDNALPVKKSVRFFEQLARTGRDLRFFGEVRVGQSPRELAACRRGGLTTIQAGIEALSDSLLARMRKGATVLDNLALMKHALEAGILLEGNLITEFPGSTEAEVTETLEHLDFVFPFQPLTTASFFLGLGSPAARAPREFGIRAVVPHPFFARLLPRQTLQQLTLPLLGYRGDRQLQKRRWAPVVAKVKAWQQRHQKRRAGVLEQPLLSYRDGTTFLLIRQELPDGRILHHRLRGLSRRVYLYCTIRRDLADIVAQFPDIAQESLVKFLADLHRKRLLFTHRYRYLALAVHRP